MASESVYSGEEEWECTVWGKKKSTYSSLLSCNSDDKWHKRDFGCVCLCTCALPCVCVSFVWMGNQSPCCSVKRSCCGYWWAVLITPSVTGWYTRWQKAHTHMQRGMAASKRPRLYLTSVYVVTYHLNGLISLPFAAITAFLDYILIALSRFPHTFNVKGHREAFLICIRLPSQEKFISVPWENLHHHIQRALPWSHSLLWRLHNELLKWFV